VSEINELQLFQQRAESFVGYFSRLAAQQDWDEWKNGEAIAAKWLQHLNEAVSSTDDANAVVEAAAELKQEGGSAAIDMYSWIVQWQKWLEVHRDTK